LTVAIAVGWRRPFAWIVALGSLAVALGVLGRAFTIVAYVRGAGDQARDLRVLGAYAVHTVEIVVVLAARGALWGAGRASRSRSCFPWSGRFRCSRSATPTHSRNARRHR
jgi:hypothetical protein